MAQAASSKALPSYLEHKSSYSGIFSWIFSTDHKRIGILYLVSVLTFFLVGVTLGFLIRLELFAPNINAMGEVDASVAWLTAQHYNAVFTLHGVIMIFLFVIPGIPAAFGNFFLPLQLGADDVAFPKINLLSWYLYITGAALVILSLFTGTQLPDTGWTFYVPYSLQTGANVPLAVFAVFVLGFSSILTGFNFIVTVHRMRCKGMTWFRMPLFVWGLYSTAWIQVLATPIIGITLALVMTDRLLNIGIFDPARGGDYLLYQHLFWIYSHPAVYIMILPALGVVSEIIPTYARRTIFGYKFIAFSSMAIALIGYLVWGHHMLTSGMADTARIVFSFLTFLVAVPTGIKIFNWVATLYKGSIKLSVSLLHILSVIFLFSIGGFTGLVVGTLNLDIHLHDTYFVVAHFHYVIFGGLGFAFFAALHHWLPKMFGKMYNEFHAKCSWALLFVGFNVLYFPMFILGYQGMPRRYYDYLPQFETLHKVSTVGSWILIAGLLYMFGNLLMGLLKGKKAPANPWGGATLEWQTTSPPPKLNFAEPPEVTTGPYDFSNVKADEITDDKTDDNEGGQK